MSAKGDICYTSHCSCRQQYGLFTASNEVRPFTRKPSQFMTAKRLLFIPFAVIFVLAAALAAAAQKPTPTPAPTPDDTTGATKIFEVRLPVTVTLKDQLVAGMSRSD